MTQKVTANDGGQDAEKQSKNEQSDKVTETIIVRGVTVSLSAADIAVLTAEEARWRAEGRPLIGQVNDRRVQVAAGSKKRVLPEMWTPVHVLDRLEEAFEILARLPMATRPKGYQSLMPTYAYEHGDLVAQIETGELERLTKMRNQYRVRGATAAEVARMEQALAWASAYLAGAPEVARAVQLGALWAALRLDAGKVLRERRINPRTFNRRKIHGMNVIATELTRRRVPVT